MMNVYNSRRAVLRCRLGESTDKEAHTAIENSGCLWQSGEVDRDTALAAAALSFSAGTKEMLTENLRELGFDSLSEEKLDNSDPSRIGYAVASKRTSSGILTAMILRGTQGAEWYSNFRIGFTAEHKGFSAAADHVCAGLGDYLNGSDSSRRFFVTGYSRGGAAANIVARRLCDRYGCDSVRCCTFAAPNTAIARIGARYPSIVNYVRDEDFFARVPLGGWGYGKYGRVVTLSGDVKKGFRRLTGEDYIGFESAGQVDAILSAIMRLAPNPHAYYKRRYKVGGRMMSLFEFMMSVADMLADNADESTGEIMADSLISEFADLSAFLSSGMDINALIAPASGIPRCSVADSHSPAAYLAALTGSGLQDTLSAIS